MQALKELFYDWFGPKSDYGKNPRNAVVKTGKIIIKCKNGYAIYRTIFLTTVPSNRTLSIFVHSTTHLILMVGQCISDWTIWEPSLPTYANYECRSRLSQA